MFQPAEIIRFPVKHTKQNMVTLIFYELGEYRGIWKVIAINGADTALPDNSGPRTGSVDGRGKTRW